MKELVHSRYVFAASAAVIVCGVVWVACQGSDSPTAPEVQSAAPGTASAGRESSVSGGPPEIDVCHGNRVVSVTKQEIPAHEAHGDLVEPYFAVNADGSCRPLVECPCQEAFDAISFDSCSSVTCVATAIPKVPDAIELKGVCSSKTSISVSANIGSGSGPTCKASLNGEELDQRTLTAEEELSCRQEIVRRAVHRLGAGACAVAAVR